MVNNLSENNSLVSQWMSELRDSNIQQDRMRFRENLRRIGQVAAYEISKTLPYVTQHVVTPLGTAHCHVLHRQPVLATIFRAGMPLYEGLLSCYDKADSAFIGAYRKHESDTSFQIAQGYIACPDLTDRPLILADPMLASGASMAQGLSTLLGHGQPSQIHIVSVVAAPEGVAAMQLAHPKAHLWIGAIDAELNNMKYIVPGLGDAGDLCFGEKVQH